MKAYYYLFFIFFSLTSQAQNTDSLFRSLAANLGLSDTVIHSNLFLHVDKTVYAASENVWFAAYLLHADEVQTHHTLHIALLDEAAHRVVSSYQFALEQGLASGSLSLPDSLLTGKYCLVGYTNKSITERSAHLFRQPIEILGLRKAPFTLEITGTYQESHIRFTGHITKNEGNKAIMPPKFSFSIIADGKLFKKFAQPISNLGEVRFEVPDTLALRSLEIVGVLGQGKEQMAFRRPLRWLSSNHLITFFVPSQRLIAGRVSQVAIRAQTTSGQAISKSCVLLENNTEIASFTTNKMGIGLFSFTPRAEKQYIVKFKGENERPVQYFPVISTGIWELRLVNSLVNDTLQLSVTTPTPLTDCIIAIHDTQKLLYGAYWRGHKPENILKVPVVKWEPGVAYVCLYTKDGTLQQRRLILIKHAGQTNATVQTDSAIYRPLSKVTLKIKLVNSKGEPLKGLFSFSSALEQVTTAEAKDIQAFDIFERFIPDRILLPPASFLQSEQEVKALLLRQEQIIADTSWSSQTAVTANEYDGYVLYNNKMPERAVDLMLFGAQAALFQSDHVGRFVLPPLSLRVNAGKKVMLSVVSKNITNYKIQLLSPWAKNDSILANQNLLHSYIVPDELIYEQKHFLASPKNVLLNDVIITAKKTDSANYYGKANTGDACTDYVCQFNVLNCPYHSGVKAPEEGHRYHRYNLETASGMTQVIYHCQYNAKPAFIKQVASTVNYTPFTPFNLSESTLPDAMNNTTLHWQAFVETDNSGEAIITFHNNARSGRYRALVQGITANGVFSSEVYFDVKK